MASVPGPVVPVNRGTGCRSDHDIDTPRLGPPWLGWWGCAPVRIFCRNWAPTNRVRVIQSTTSCQPLLLRCDLPRMQTCESHSECDTNRSHFYVAMTIPAPESDDCHEHRK